MTIKAEVSKFSIESRQQEITAWQSFYPIRLITQPTMLTLEVQMSPEALEEGFIIRLNEDWYGPNAPAFVCEPLVVQA